MDIVIWWNYLSGAHIPLKMVLKMVIGWCVRVAQCDVLDLFRYVAVCIHGGVDMLNIVCFYGYSKD